MQRAAPFGDTGGVPGAPVVVVGAGTGRPDGGAAAGPPGPRGARRRAARRALSAAPRRAPGRRGVPGAAGGRRGRRGARAQPTAGRAAAARRRATACWPSSAATRRRGRERLAAGLDACTSPTWRRSSPRRPRPTPASPSTRGVEVTGLDQDDDGVTIVVPGRRSGPVRPRVGGARLRRGRQHGARRSSGRRCATSARPTAGWCSTSGRRRRCCSGRACTRSATPAGRRPSCTSPATGTAGSRRLAPGETVADATTPARLAALLAPVDPAAVEIVRAVEYMFRAQVADRWRDRRGAAGRRRGPPEPAVRRTGARARAARRAPAGLEARRRPGGRGGRRPAGQLPGRAGAARPGADRGGAAARPADDRGWPRGRRRPARCARRRPPDPGRGRLATDSRTPPLAAGPQVERRGRAGRRLAGTLVPAAGGRRGRTAVPLRRRAGPLAGRCRRCELAVVGPGS